jgi:hypothetical protein
MGGLEVEAKEVGALLESAYEDMALALEGALEALLEAYEEVERARAKAEGVPALLRDYFSEVLRRRKERVLLKTALPAGLRLEELHEYMKNTVRVDSWLLERGKLRDCATGLVRRLELDAEPVLATVRGLEEAASRLRRAPEVARRLALRRAKWLLSKEEALQELRRRATLGRFKAL